jgi:parallel beta-helix repeat protein
MLPAERRNIMATLKALTCFVMTLFAALFLCAERVQATDISGTITNTLFIFDDSRLVGDVTCAVPMVLPGSNPCIAFGTDHIKLRLNGHTITGPVTPPTGCSLPTDSMFGVGIEAIDREHVQIEGPGIIQHFERWGILLGLTGHPSSHVTVRKVTVYRNCWSGMQTFSTSDSNFEEDVWVDNAGGSNGAACGGICLQNSNKNVMHKSTFYGNGSVDYANGNVDFGIGFEGSSSENRVEQNDIGGNTNGVSFFNSSSGNLVRRNIIVGNPAAQVIKTFTAANQQVADITFRPNFTGANNTIENNFCLTYLQGAGPATAPCPNIKTAGVEEAANRVSRPPSSQNASGDDSKAVLKGRIASLLASPMSLVLLGGGVIGGIARQQRRARYPGRN